VPAVRAEALEPLATGVPLGGEGDQLQPPSHVLYEGRAFALDRGPLAVGRGGDGETAIVLPEGLAGVSRRHCTFLHDGEHLVLVDHSAYGTFVNGERVAERVRLLAGDRVRIGEPGVELSLIAVGA
jgi:pSer/pThr/pTyr-binding forkhead associated (FHA) protein